jgi:hypothetical protein
MDPQAPNQAQPDQAPPIQQQPTPASEDLAGRQMAQEIASDMQNGPGQMIAQGVLGGEILLLLVLLASGWKIFTKANQAGWKILVPFYNLWIMLKIACVPGYYLILLLIPGVNIFASLRIAHRVSKGFGHGAGFTAGMVFLPFIFYPMLAFGNSQYHPAES